MQSKIMTVITVAAGIFLANVAYDAWKKANA